MSPTHASPRIQRLKLAMLLCLGAAQALVFMAMNAFAADAHDSQPAKDGKPPKPPTDFNPDPGVPPVQEHAPADEEIGLNYRRIVTPGSAASNFNPDPGVPPVLPKVSSHPDFGLPFDLDAKMTNGLAAPTTLRRMLLEPETKSPQRLIKEVVRDDLALPRQEVTLKPVITQAFPPATYPATAAGDIPENSEARTNRWKISYEPWQRYTTGQAETPYQEVGLSLWHPYKQSLLKGDSPILGQDIFLNLTASMQNEFEARRMPARKADFVGTTEDVFSQNYLGFSADLFRGQTVFRPANWRFRVRPVFNVNHLDSTETGTFTSGITSRDVTRTKTFMALQEAYAEVALKVLSDNYDFLAGRFGNQPFNSDFRGFIFNDINSGLRLFGNASNNQWQYNLAFFDMREKETFSELNSFDERGQQVIVASLYRQDFLREGYTAQLSFHANLDHGDPHRNQSGSVIRPSPLGLAKEHEVHAFYLGWAGDGHVGRLNLTHAFYQALGNDEFNGLAGRPVDINARMAALELSLDQDWLRYKGSLFYASGDSNPKDGEGGGFDSILDSPYFAGAPFSYWARQGFSLGGAPANLKSRNSLLPTLRSSKLEGQSSFVNPGLFLAGVGVEARITPKLRSFAQANYLRFAETAPLQSALGGGAINNEIGIDLSIGFQYRPFLVENFVVNAGFGALVPGSGYRDIYPPAQRAGGVPYSALVTLSLSY